MQGTDGNFYGMTTRGRGGYNDYGSMFKITPDGVFTNLHYFNGNNGGSHPIASLIQGTDGNFYGTTFTGGVNGHGIIFKITPDGTFAVIHQLKSSTDGANPYSSLVQAKDGNLFGMTYTGGRYNYGTIFRITPYGAFRVLRHLNSATDGANPYGNLTLGTDGYLYGMTYLGGANNGGTIFKMRTDGAFTVLRHLTEYSSEGISFTWFSCARY